MADDGRGQTLESVLQEVYLALRGGDLSQLETLSDRAEAALLQLSAPTDAETAKRLRDLARRNAACLDAAARGIRSARRRLGEIRDAQGGTRTYDGHGHSQRIGPSDARLSHRA